MASKIVQMWTPFAVVAIRRAPRPGDTAPHRTAGPGPDAGYGAPGGAAAAPCGAASAHPCASIDVAMGEAASGDTIGIAAGTYTAATTRNLVVVSKSLTLTGAGAGSTILDGNLLGTVVTVGPSVTATVSGLTITDGSGTPSTIQGAHSLAGGGVLQIGTLLLSDVTVSRNTSELRR